MKKQVSGNLYQLIRRVKKLEQEQLLQEEKTQALHSLPEDINKLEEDLKHVNDYKFSETVQIKGFEDLRDLVEISRLEAKLEQKDEAYAVTDDAEQHYFEEIDELQHELTSPEMDEAARKAHEKRLHDRRQQDLAEIARLESELAEMEKNYETEDDKEKRYFAEIEQLQQELLSKNKKPKEEATFFESVPIVEETEKLKTTQHGYVIRLVFDPKQPIEWSEEGGGGWHEKGHGTYYPSFRALKAVLTKLKHKWPDYPLQIVKR